MHSQVRQWLQNPVTQRVFELIREHREANLQELLSVNLVNNENIAEFSKLKAQVNTFDLILDVESFLDGEFIDENVQTS